MKKFQNMFTTIEQSKKLLALGVPGDTADCIYIKHVSNDYYDLEILQDRTYSEEVSEFDGYFDIVPCWSAGRLIEIIRECGADYDTCKILIETLVTPTTDNVDALVELICYAKNELNNLDLSKLDE